MQEYFAAQFIYKDAKTNQDIILKTIYESENIDKYINLLDIYFDIDNWGFKKNILYPLCSAYIEFYQNNVFSSSLIEEKDIQARIGLLFMREVCLIQSDKELPFSRIEELAKNVLAHPISSMAQYTKNFISVSSYIDPRRKLFPILEKRLKNLFTRNNYFVDINKCALPFNQVIKINVDTGAKDIQEYTQINYYLSEGPHYSISLDYEECKKACRELSKLMEQKEKTIKLVEGL